jgi:hypothetical protein
MSDPEQETCLLRGDVAVLLPNMDKIAHSPLARWDTKRRVNRVDENQILWVKNNSG